VEFDDVLEIENDDEFGELEVTSISDGTIKMESTGDITLSKDDTVEIAEGISFKVADADALIYYPFVERYIGEDNSYLKIESSSPSTTTFTGDENTPQLFKISVNQPANFTWFLDGVNVQIDSSSVEAAFYASGSSSGEHGVRVVASNDNGSVAKEWKWIVQKGPVIVDSLEIRSHVYEGTHDIVITPAEFAGFFYELDDDIGSEMLGLRGISFRTIPEGYLNYSTSIQQVEYSADFENEDSLTNNQTYSVLGFFAEEFVSVDDDTPDELVKLLLDNDDKHTLMTGSTLELPNGYELTAKQIDVEGDKVWLELSKDGEFIENEIINVVCGSATWTYDTDVGDTDDVIVFRALITDVFQGQVDSLAVIEGLYLVEFDDVLKIENDDEFGELEVSSIAGGTIFMESTGTIILSKDSIVDIAEGLSFKVADDDTIRFCLIKEVTEPGTCEIRGTVSWGTGAWVWTPSNFAGFSYDLDDNI
ncbi:MAG: hypothetical protein MJB12_15630, partial [Firmicutes bacterium]|nr:hypothetical protein [Bacillota bacterium]